MTRSQAYLEEISSQIPALQLLINLSWQYLTPAEALHLREGREKNVVLTGILEQPTALSLLTGQFCMRVDAGEGAGVNLPGRKTIFLEGYTRHP